MACCPTSCNTTGLYRFKAISYGIPAPVHAKLLGRVNGLIQDFPRGFEFQPCQIPCTESCAPPIPGTAPTLVDDATIPTDVVGTDDYLLAKPAAWIPAKDSAGNSVVIPGYTPAP